MCFYDCVLPMCLCFHLQEVYVRDTIEVKSSNEDRPFIAKIASIWQESGVQFHKEISVLPEFAIHLAY